MPTFAVKNEWRGQYTSKESSGITTWTIVSTSLSLSVSLESLYDGTSSFF
jgi:hypothetical protein